MTVAVLDRRLGAQIGRCSRPRAAGLTRRGWLVLAVLALGLLLAAFQAGAATAPGNYIPTRPVVVTTGDTLWSIATQATLGGGDVQAMVVELQRINGLKDSRLQVGDVLEVPRQ